MTLRPLALAIFAAFSVPAFAEIDIATIECGGVQVGDDVLDMSDLQAVEVPEPLLRKCGIKDGVKFVSGEYRNGVFYIDSRAEYLNAASFLNNSKKDLRYLESTPGATMTWKAGVRDGALSGAATLRYGDYESSVSYNESAGFNLNSAFADYGAYRVGMYSLPGAGSVIGVGYGYNNIGSSFSRHIYAESQEVATFAKDIEVFDQAGKLVDTIKMKSPGVYDLAELAQKYKTSGSVMIDGQRYGFTAEERITSGEGLKVFAGLREKYEDGEETLKPFASISHAFFPASWLGVKPTLTSEGGSISFETFSSSNISLRGYYRHDDGRDSAGVNLGYRSKLGNISANVTMSDDRHALGVAWSGRISKNQNLSLGASIDSEGNKKYRASTTFRIPSLTSASLRLSATHYDNANGRADTQVSVSVNIPLGKALKGTPAENIFKNINLGQDGEMGISGSVLGADYKLKKTTSTNGGKTSIGVDYRALSTDFDLEYDFEGGSYDIGAEGQIFTDFRSVSFGAPNRNAAFLEVGGPEGAKVRVDGKVAGTIGSNGRLDVTLPGDKNIRVVVDDRESLSAVRYPDQTFAVKSGEKAKVMFEYEEMQ